MIAIKKQRRSRKSRQRKWNECFLAMLPQIQQQASHACGGKDPEQREEFTAEVVANAWELRRIPDAVFGARLRQNSYHK